MVAGETLTGTLMWEAGETIGTNAIGQGTLTEINNPNHAIAYTGADFTITYSALDDAAGAVAVAQTAVRREKARIEENIGVSAPSSTVSGAQVRVVSTGIRLPEEVFGEE